MGLSCFGVYKKHESPAEPGFRCSIKKTYGVSSIEVQNPCAYKMNFFLDTSDGIKMLRWVFFKHITVWDIASGVLQKLNFEMLHI